MNQLEIYIQTSGIELKGISVANKMNVINQLSANEALVLKLCPE